MSTPPSGEIEAPVRLPLISAIKALGDPNLLLSATDLELVITKFPKGEMENRFVTGLQGKVTAPVNNKVNDQATVRMAKGDLFRIRWDFDPGNDATTTKEGYRIAAKDGKGVHVNAEFFGTGSTIKIAFTPSNTPVVDRSTNRNSTLFEQAVRDQSHFLEYNTKPNVLGPLGKTYSSVYTPAERTSLAGSSQEAALKAMAQKLAEVWVRKAVTAGEPAIMDKDAWLMSATYRELSS